MSDHMSSLTDRSERRIKNFRTLLNRIYLLSPKFLASLAVIVAIAKSGLRFSDSIETFLSRTSSTQDFDAYFQSSPIVLIAAQLFEISNKSEWIVVYSITTVLFVVLLVWRTTRLIPQNPKLVAILIILGPPLTVSFTEIGRYDIFFLIGATLLLTEKSPLSFFGATLMFMANIEQGWVATFSVALLALIPSFRPTRRTFVVQLVMAGIFSTITKFVWFGSVVQDESRTAAFWRNLRTSLVENFLSLPLLVYSGLGILWVPVTMLVLNAKGGLEKFLMVTALVIVPLAVTMTTLDGTRVFVCTAFLPVLIAMRLGEVGLHLGNTKERSCKLIFLAVLLPSINIYVYGQVKLPYLEIRNAILGS